MHSADVYCFVNVDVIQRCYAQNKHKYQNKYKTVWRTRNDLVTHEVREDQQCLSRGDSHPMDLKGAGGRHQILLSAFSEGSEGSFLMLISLQKSQNGR